MEAKSKKPAETPFKQQNLKAWQPILTPIPVITTFIVLGIVFIPIGIVLLLASESVVEVQQRYDNLDSCSTLPSLCNVTLEVTETMKKPVFLYYRLNKFYQNHRRYVKSRNDNQLRGEVVDQFSALTDCDPRKSLDDSEDKNKFYNPCGLIAWSMFNDTFVLLDPNNGVVPLRKQGIAWESDVTQKFKNPKPEAPGIRVIADFTDEDFIVWMRTAGLPDFKKLYRIIDQDLEPGNYTIIIHNNYPVADFKGEKYAVLSTTSWIGGKNPFLGWAYIVVGIVCLFQGVAFALKHKISPRPLGDTTYLEWNK